MRILMLNNEFPPLGGGTGVINLHFLRELEVYPDIQIDLVTSSRDQRTYETETFSAQTRIYRVPVDNRNIHHATNAELMRYAWRGWRTSCELMHSNHYDASFAWAGVPAGAIAYALNRQYRLPYLLSLQGPDVPGFEARYNYLYPALKPLLRQIWRRAGVVTASSRGHQQLALRTVSDIDIPVVYNGVDTDVFAPASRGESCEVRVLCVGRLIERKGQHHLLHAFAEASKRYAPARAVLTLVGTGDAEVSLKRLAAQLQIEPLVRFVGFVPRELMPEIYHKADIFVLPSQEEGMSVALLEALATGLPVIVSEAGGTAELVTPEQNGFVVPWADIKGLTAALERMVGNADLRAQMGKVSRQVALAHSWRAMTEQFMQLLNQAIRGKRTQPSPPAIIGSLT